MKQRRAPMTSMLEAYPEPSLLSKIQLERWKGLKIGYFNATGFVRGYVCLDQPCIGLFSAALSRQTGLGPTEFALNCRA